MCAITQYYIRHYSMLHVHVGAYMVTYCALIGVVRMQDGRLPLKPDREESSAHWLPGSSPGRTSGQQPQKEKVIFPSHSPPPPPPPSSNGATLSGLQYSPSVVLSITDTFISGMSLSHVAGTTSMPRVTLSVPLSLAWEP